MIDLKLLSWYRNEGSIQSFVRSKMLIIIRVQSLRGMLCQQMEAS